VRKLKEILFDLYGEINLEILKNNENISTPFHITKDSLERYLIKYDKIIEKKIHKNCEIGIINGLWANMLGSGGIIPIQTLFYPSSTFLQLQLTGLQGDVMKESMNVAKSLAWSLTKDSIKKKWLDYFDKTKCQGLHIHCPDGSISKDGPSAGAAITTAIYSLLNNLKIKNNIAITGEITLNGNITAIGGLDIKIRYGIKAGVKMFLYPKENERDITLLKEKFTIPNDIKLIEVEEIKDIFNYVFL
jgi:ATP-dependent Lon protease